MLVRRIQTPEGEPRWRVKLLDTGLSLKRSLIHAIASNPEARAQTALGRTGLPDDIGNAVAALLTEPNGWINAQRIDVSGGMFI